MFARRSLGDSPFEHESSDIGLLDFIGRGIDESVTPVAIEIPEIETVLTEIKHDKKTVSYYLETDLVKRVKALATLTEQSYSSLVTEALRKLLKEYGF